MSTQTGKKTVKSAINGVFLYVLLPSASCPGSIF